MRSRDLTIWFMPARRAPEAIMLDGAKDVDPTPKLGSQEFRILTAHLALL